MRTSRPDYILILVSAILLILGILALFSVSSQEKPGQPFYFLNHQLLFGLIPGLILSFFAFHLNLNFFKKWALILLLINLIFLVMLFLPSDKFFIGGVSSGGATRWLSLGFISFQPPEFLKLTFILYLAAWLNSRLLKKERLNNQKSKLIFNFNRQNLEKFNQTFIAFLIVVGIISLLLIFQPDISTLGIIIISGALVYFLAGTPIWHSLFLILAGGLSLLILIKLAPYRLARILVFLKPETDPLGIGYQVKQSLIAVGSGGISGLGLGLSRQKFGFLPEPMSDTIFAIFAEETGFVGSLVLISLFLIFFWRVLKISTQTRDHFAKLTALGIGFWIILQAFVNIGSMIGILPLTGIPLPFISYGGSHLVAEMIGLGILLNISKEKKTYIF